MSIDDATRFANVRNFPKLKQSNADFVPNTMVTVEIAIINSTRGAQHFALHPACIALPSRRCFWFLVVFNTKTGAAYIKTKRLYDSGRVIKATLSIPLPLEI